MAPFDFMKPLLDVISSFFGAILAPFDPFVLFGVVPYVAVIVMIIGFMYRFFSDRFSFSSQSSQFLAEKMKMNFGSIFFHYGLITILLSHLVVYIIGVLFPAQWTAFIIAVPLFLPAIEVTGWVATIVVIIGLFLFLARRISSPLLRVVTTKLDWLLLIVLIFQVGLGFWIATIHYPGASWYVSTIVPWLQSLITLSPNPALMAGTSPEVQMHILSALFLVAILPFTRLVHSLSVTVVSYLWRPYQVVVWISRKRSSNPKKAEEISR